MSGTAVTARQTGMPDSDVEEMRLSLNKAIADIEALRLALDTVADQLDADAGVTDTDYAANAAVATAGTMTANLVNI